MGLLSGSFSLQLVSVMVSSLGRLITSVLHLQLANHGIPVELLEHVKKVCSACYKLRQESFKESNPVQLLNKLVEEESEGGNVERLNDVDWEDVFVLQDDKPWPSNPPEFK